MKAWRWPARLVIAVGVVVAFGIDSRVEPSPPEQIVSAASIEEPQLVPALGALTSTWFCPTVFISPDDMGVAVESTLRIANLQSKEIPVTITTMSPTSRPVSFLITVAGGSVADLDMRNRVDADRVSAIVEAPGGHLAVSRRLESEWGSDIAPCAPRAGEEWSVAAGDTQRDAVEQLIVFNPFPDDAVIDVLFATEVEAGAFQAAEFQAIVVPGRDVASIDLGNVVRRRDQVSVNLVARTGRVVVDRIQAFDNSEGRSGMAVALGSVTARELWFQPGVVVDVGTVASIHVHNPNDIPAEIDVAAESAVLFATGDPIGLSVPARDTVVIPIVATGSRDEGLRLDVDPGIAVGLVVESANGVAVVVDLELEVVEVDLPASTTTTSTTTTSTTTAPTTTVPTTAEGDEQIADDGTETDPAATTVAPTTTIVPTTTTELVIVQPPPVLRDPRARSGLAHSTFSSRLATTWLALGESEFDVLSAVLIHNPSERVAEVVLARLDATITARVQIEPGTSLGVPFAPGVDALILESSLPVTVAVTAERVGGVGVMYATAFPLS